MHEVLRVAFVLIVLAGPLTALAQPAGKVHRVGILSAWPFSSLTLTRQFPEALRELGYVEGPPMERSTARPPRG